VSHFHGFHCSLSCGLRILFAAKVMYMYYVNCEAKVLIVGVWILPFLSAETMLLFLIMLTCLNICFKLLPCLLYYAFTISQNCFGSS
jgi:hypothetical protein